jgi:SAM-dependent methyltransferase
VVTEGELSYFDLIGDGGREHSLRKPFSDVDRAGLLLELGAVFSLLPAPPSAVLDCGCGTGWLTWMLQRSGYGATGIDVAPRAIELARSNPPFTGTEPPKFDVGDVVSMSYSAAFDAVVFFDSLHHVLDEEATLRNVLAALRPGGICITSEPGHGHTDASTQQIAAFGVTERDMPADHIAKVGVRVGFASAQTYPRADAIGVRVYETSAMTEPTWKRRLRMSAIGRSALTLKTTEFAKKTNGIVVLVAPT